MELVRTTRGCVSRVGREVTEMQNSCEYQTLGSESLRDGII